MENKDNHYIKPIQKELLLIAKEQLGDDKDIKELEYLIKKNYGLTYEQFAESRNEFINKHENPTDMDFHNYLINQIIIDLVGRDYLSLGNITTKELQYVITDKATSTMIDIILNKNYLLPKDIPYNSHLALICFRNLELLP